MRRETILLLLRTGGTGTAPGFSRLGDLGSTQQHQYNRGGNHQTD